MKPLLTIESGLSSLDQARRRSLRALSQVPGWAPIFVSRERRLWWGFCLTAVVTLCFALLMPLLLLVISPLLFGGLHLMSSLRYSTEVISFRMVRFQSVFRSFALVAIGVAGLRLTFPELPHLEVAGLGVLFLILVIAMLKTPGLTRPELFTLGPVAIGVSLVAGAWMLWPLLTAGILAFGHNVIAFEVWRRFAKRRGEVGVVLQCFFIFLFLHLLLFMGAFDFVLNWAPVAWGFQDSLWQFEYVSGFLGFPVEGVWIYRVTVAFAVGQSLHYFVWLRAIPDQYLQQQIPLSFTQSFRTWQQRVGPWALCVTLILALVFPFTWFWLGLAAAQILYFSLSGFHGYWELIAVLMPGSHE